MILKNQKRYLSRAARARGARSAYGARWEGIGVFSFISIGHFLIQNQNGLQEMI